MKVISWNVRGINGLNKHRMLRRKIHQEKPTILLIQETKSNSENLQTLLSRLWKNNKSIAVDAARASGGLAITWNPSNITLNDFTTTRNSISTSYHLIGTDVHGFITNVYGPQTSDQKINLLNLLDWYKKEQPRQNWILGGDFNLITNLSGKERRSPPTHTGGHKLQEFH
jgi:exonuclease III